MHLLCHILDLLRKHGKISTFNSQGLNKKLCQISFRFLKSNISLYLYYLKNEKIHNLIKQQISANNNRRDTTKSCIKYFPRNNFLIYYQREKRKNKK
jgi:hypothetical protein